MSTKKAVKKPAITPKSVGKSPGLSINPIPGMAKFRTKDKTLVATGYEKVQQDEDGVYRVYFKASQMYQRNLVQVESGGTIYDYDRNIDKNGPRPARYNSKDAAKVEFLVPWFFLSPLTPEGTWKAAAADLYVDGVPVWTA
jgi:hypothetical protein